MFTSGFSIIEIMIALALMTTIMVGAVEAVSVAQYWQISASAANVAVLKSTREVDRWSRVRAQNFQEIQSMSPTVSADLSDAHDASCLAGGLCYVLETTVADISSCAKEVIVSVHFRVGARYATSTVSRELYVPNVEEIVSVGSDCLVMQPSGNWTSGITQTSTLLQPPYGSTGIDVLGQYMYVTSAASPHLRIFALPTDLVTMPTLVGSSTGASIRLNDIEVARDMSSGRTYAYVTQHSTTSQLVVYDVTDGTVPVRTAERSLFGVASEGSFPQGWRLHMYGGELFVVSRETTGPELHIFLLDDFSLPVEKTSAVINLNRTVNDLVVRDEVVDGVRRRFLYLAASSDLKEVGVYDVSDNVPIEVAAINLAGTADASALYLSGDVLYVGRKNSAASELLAFDVAALVRGQLSLFGVSEVGSDILALTGNAQVLLAGTGRAGEEVQLWSKDTNRWSAGVQNAGRLSFVSSSRLAPLGLETGTDSLYTMSHSQSQPENITIFTAP